MVSPSKLRERFRSGPGPSSACRCRSMPHNVSPSNISAVLDLLGVQWVNGYKPLAHYQDALVSAVERSLVREQGFLYPASPEIQPAEPGEDGILIPPPPFGDPDETLEHDVFIRKHTLSF
jgi:hypothetical protein